MEVEQIYEGPVEAVLAFLADYLLHSAKLSGSQETIVTINLQNSTILLLCSDGVARTAMQEALERGGHLVQSAHDLGSAVASLDEEIPQLLIVSPYVDCISGHDAAVYLRTRHHGLRVLIVGGFLEDNRLRDREELQSFAVFPRPFTPAALLDKVREVLLATNQSLKSITAQ